MKTEVFIAYDPRTTMQELSDTLLAWDTDSYEPVAIEVTDVKKSTLIHVAAEAIAKGDYIVAPLGSAPESESRIIKKGSIKVAPCHPMIQ